MLKSVLALSSAFALFGAPALAQSPNNSSIVVLVTDQSGAVVEDARVLVTNEATGAAREGLTSAEGSASFPALPLTGTYAVSVTRQGFGDESRGGLALRSAETATVKVKLLVGTQKAEVTVIGTDQGVRADGQIGVQLDSKTIDDTQILGRKVTTLPLFNSAFRQGKGTGDLFVNATYFITGSGSRRTTTYMLDGASNDEGWGRQTMLTTVPLGASRKRPCSPMHSRRSSAGRRVRPSTSSPIGHQCVARRSAVPGPPRRVAGEDVLDRRYCAPSVPTCTTPASLAAINPTDLPDELHQVSGSVGGPISNNRTFFFATGDYTHQDRTTQLSPSLPSFVLPPDGDLSYVGHYRQALMNGRIDHKLATAQSLMVRANYDHFYDTNPNDAVVGTSAPTVARRYTRRIRVGAGESHDGHQRQPAERIARRVPARIARDAVGGAGAVDDVHPRRIGAVHDRRIAAVRHHEHAVPAG